jgi:hypothetical protein
MSPLAGVALQSLNQLVDQQKTLSGDSCFTLTLFNNDVSLIHDAVALRDVPPLLPAQYEPSGGTSLNDAVVHLIHSLGRHAQGRNTAVLAVILTDGMENGSRHSQEDVRQMVTYRRLTHGWQFLFLGPESALSYALSIGIPKVNTAGFETTPEGLRFMLKRLGQEHGRLRTRRSPVHAQAQVVDLKRKPFDLLLERRLDGRKDVRVKLINYLWTLHRRHHRRRL